MLSVPGIYAPEFSLRARIENDVQLSQPQGSNNSNNPLPASSQSPTAATAISGVYLNSCHVPGSVLLHSVIALESQNIGSRYYCELNFTDEKLRN